MITFPGLPPVDRALFIPDQVWVKEPRKPWAALTRQESPQEWARLVAADEAIATQIKDGVWPCSSSSAPWLMAQVIATLRLEPGMRVLEIGTGTGYNAACLSALGAHVVSVEIDEEIADQARANLAAAGHPDVEVVAGDGERGHRDGAPYDRVIAAAAAHTVPYAWVEQTKEGGLLVVPYTGTGYKGGMLVLGVGGGVARGGFEGEAHFMPLRGQGLSQADQRAIVNDPGLYVEVAASGQRLGTAPSQS